MKNITTEIKWGMIFFSVTLLWMYFEKLMGWHGPNIEQHATYTMLFAIPAILVYVFALLDKRKNAYEGKMNWKQGFFTGLIITLIVTVLSPLGQLIIHTIISPEYFPNVIEYAVEQDKMSRSEAESQFNLSSYIFQATFGALVMGIVTSAIVALIVKKTK